MLAIAPRALMSPPNCSCWMSHRSDSPPLIVQKIFEILKEINAEGTTIFLVEQNAHPLA